MKKILVALLEGVIVGAILGIVLVVLDIEITAVQSMIIVLAAMSGTSAASSIGQWINTGKSPIRYEWVYSYDGNRIEVSASLTEKLYINDELVDENKKIKLNKAELSGKLKSGEEVKAVIKGGVTAKCELSVGSELLQPIAVKTP